MGNLVGYTGMTEEGKFIQAMMDSSFKDFYNNLIRKEGKELYEIAMLINTEDDNHEANDRLRALYQRRRLEWEGRDNSFCYALADKMIKWRGFVKDDSRNNETKTKEDENEN